MLVKAFEGTHYDILIMLVICTAAGHGATTPARSGVPWAIRALVGHPTPATCRHHAVIAGTVGRVGLLRMRSPSGAWSTYSF